MWTLPSSVKIYVAAEPVDLRRGFDGLAATTRSVIGQSPLSGDLFVFLNRRRNRVKSWRGIERVTYCYTNVWNVGVLSCRRRPVRENVTLKWTLAGWATTIARRCRNGCVKDEVMKAKSKTTPRADPNDASAPPALRQIRDSARSLATEGKTEEAFDLLVSALDAVLRKSRELELKVLKLERERAGKRSERVDPGQLQLMFEQLMSESGDDGDEKPELDLEAEAREDAEPERQIEEAQKTRRRAKRKKPRRETIRTAGIERELPLDSNLCEQQMRAIALGRRSRFSRRRSTRRLSLHPHAHLRRERRTNIAVPYGRAPQTRRRLA